MDDAERIARLARMVDRLCEQCVTLRLNLTTVERERDEWRQSFMLSLESELERIAADPARQATLAAPEGPDGR